MAGQDIVADIDDGVAVIDGYVTHSALCDKEVYDRIVHEIIGVEDAVLTVHVGLEDIAEYRIHPLEKALLRNDYHAGKSYADPVGL